MSGISPQLPRVSGTVRCGERVFHGSPGPFSCRNHFWSINGYEVDGVSKTEAGTFPIECKASLKFKKQHLSGLNFYLHHYQGRLGFLMNLAPPERIQVNAQWAIQTLPIYLASEWQRFVRPDRLNGISPDDQ